MRVIAREMSHLAGKTAGHHGGWGRCSTCLHKDRSAIEAAITAGASLAATAKRFGLSPSALQRHIDRHPRAALVKVTPRRAALVNSGGDDTSTKLMGLLAAVETILDNAGSTTQALDAIREARALVVAHGSWQLEREKVMLLRQPAAAVDLMKSEEFVAARTVMMKVLDHHPEARAEMVLALRALNQRSGKKGGPDD
jgi:transposase-like protein